MTAERVTAPPIDWLLAEGEPWVRYWTYRDLLDYPSGHWDVKTAHEETVAHPLVSELITDLADWPGPPLKRHNDAQHPLHKLATLAEFGLSREDALLKPIIGRVLDRQSREGAFAVSMLVSQRFGGDGLPHMTWMICDAPTVLFCMLAFGMGNDPGVQRALRHLGQQVGERGWPCVVSDEMGDFRGPGRKDDPCPYATLVALKALSRVPELHDSPIVRSGIDALLWHWDIQKERKIYLFGIGTDFRKPKYPLVWYDILHVTDVLSRFAQARQDARFQAMLAELMMQADYDGRFTARSMYRAWGDWDFADKKAPSPTITATAWRTFKRAAVDA